MDYFKKIRLLASICILGFILAGIVGIYSAKADKSRALLINRYGYYKAGLEISIEKVDAGFSEVDISGITQSLEELQVAIEELYNDDEIEFNDVKNREFILKVIKEGTEGISSKELGESPERLRAFISIMRNVLSLSVGQIVNQLEKGKEEIVKEQAKTNITCMALHFLSFIVIALSILSIIFLRISKGDIYKDRDFFERF